MVRRELAVQTAKGKFLGGRNETDEEAISSIVSIGTGVLYVCLQQQ
jgi:hypothetical protein